MSEYKIEKDVPLPEAYQGGRKTIYPYASMEVGDSFFVPNTTQRQISGSVQTYQKLHGVKFATRKDGDGVRIWRTA